jgi:hypothetical protein
MRWKGKVDENINLAVGSKDGNVDYGIATQWERPVWLWRRVGGKVVQRDFTRFVSALTVGVEGVSACFWHCSTCMLWLISVTSYIAGGSFYKCRHNHFLSAIV